MSDTMISVGKILENGDISYRIISVSIEQIVLCRMGISRLDLLPVPYLELRGMLADGGAVITEDEEAVIDMDKLTNADRQRYEEKLQVMREVEDAYGPTFLGLIGKKPKPQLNAILETHSMQPCTFWRALSRYLQSGMRAVSLVDAKAFGPNRGKEYNYTTRTGRKPKRTLNSYILTETDKEHMAEALKWYSSGHFKSKRDAFNEMRDTYYLHEEIVNGVSSLAPLPENQRPNINQFYHYVRTHLTKEEGDRIKTSAMEQRNSQRLLNSDALNGVYGPGDMVEIDAIEFDCSLVAPWDHNRSVIFRIVHIIFYNVESRKSTSELQRDSTGRSAPQPRVDYEVAFFRGGFDVLLGKVRRLRSLVPPYLG